jgi:hypothetical protein
MARRGRTLVRIAAFGTLALLLSACIKLDMDLTVASDDTVSGTVVFALNKQLIQLSGQSADDILGSSAPVPSGVQGVSSEPYEDADFQGQRYTFDSVPLSRFNDESGSQDQLRIRREGDTFVVSGALDLSSATGASGLSGASGFPGAEQIFQSAEMKITITFPGPVQRSNGKIDGNSVTWIPKVGERLELQATASAIDSGGTGSTTIILIVVAAVVVIAAIVVAVLLARRRRPVPATADAAGADAAGADAAGGAPPEQMPSSDASPVADRSTMPPPATTDPPPPATTDPPPPGDTPPPPPPPPGDREP